MKKNLFIFLFLSFCVQVNAMEQLMTEKVEDNEDRIFWEKLYANLRSPLEIVVENENIIRPALDAKLMRKIFKYAVLTEEEKTKLENHADIPSKIFNPRVKLHDIHSPQFVSKLAFNSSGTYLASSGANYVPVMLHSVKNILNNNVNPILLNNPMVDREEPDGVSSLVFHSDDTRLSIGTLNGKDYIYDMNDVLNNEKATPIKKEHHNNNHIDFTTFNSSKKYFATASDTSVKFYDIQKLDNDSDCKPIAQNNINGVIKSITFDSSDKYFAIAGLRNLQIYTTKKFINGESPLIFLTPEGSLSVDFDPSSTYLAVGYNNGSIKLFKPRDIKSKVNKDTLITEQEPSSIEIRNGGESVTSAINCLTFDPTGSYLATASTSQSEINLFQVKNLLKLTKLLDNKNLPPLKRVFFSKLAAHCKKNPKDKINFTDDALELVVEN